MFLPSAENTAYITIRFSWTIFFVYLTWFELYAPFNLVTKENNDEKDELSCHTLDIIDILKKKFFICNGSHLGVQGFI